MSAAFAQDPCACMVCHVLAMKSYHDWRGLRKGVGMLRDSWLRFYRSGKCHSVGLRSAILVLLRRMGSIPPTSEQFNRDQADRMLQLVASSTESCEDEDDQPSSIRDQPAPHDAHARPIFEIDVTSSDDQQSLENVEDASSEESFSVIGGAESPPHRLQKEAFWSRRFPSSPESPFSRDCWPSRSPDQTLRLPSDPDPFGCIAGEDQVLDAPAPEVRPKSMSVSNRLRNWQPKLPRPTKYGRCPSCRVARQPWIYKSGRRAGQAAYVRSRFFAKDSSKCFVSQMMTKQQLEQMPKRFRETHASLAMSLRRAGKADWQRVGP